MNLFARQSKKLHTKLFDKCFDLLKGLIFSGFEIIVFPLRNNNMACGQYVVLLLNKGHLSIYSEIIHKGCASLKNIILSCKIVDSD